MKRSPSRKRRLLNLSLFTGFLIVLVLLGALLKLMHMQAMAFAHSPRTYAEVLPSDVGIEDWERVTFQTADNVRLEGWYLPPQSSQPGAALVYVHGWAGNRSNYLAEAALLAEYGYGALLFDLRNHGSSGGDVTTMGLYEVEDVQAAFIFLAAQPEVDPTRIGIFGGSMGGATAIRAMKRIPTAQVLIIATAYSTFEDVVEDGIRSQIGIPGWPWAQIILWMAGRESDANLFAICPIDDIANIAPRPVLIIHGTDDATISLAHAQHLFDAAGEPKDLYVVSGGGHGGFLQFAPDEYEQRVVSFLQQYLPAG